MASDHHELVREIGSRKIAEDVVSLRIVRVELIPDLELELHRKASVDEAIDPIVVLDGERQSPKRAREASGELITQGIGAWTVIENGERSYLRHNLFVPKDAWAPGLAESLALAELSKLQRVNQLLNGAGP